MTYIVTETCVDLKDKACIEVCPVDCIHETDDAAGRPGVDGADDNYR